MHSVSSYTQLYSTSSFVAAGMWWTLCVVFPMEYLRQFMYSRLIMQKRSITWIMFQSCHVVTNKFLPMITVVIPNNNDHDHLRFLRVIVTGKWVSTIAINHSKWAVIAIRWFPSHNQLVHSSSRLVMSIHTGSHNKSRELQCIVRSRLQDDLQWWTGDDPLSYFMTLYITLFHWSPPPLVGQIPSRGELCPLTERSSLDACWCLTFHGVPECLPGEANNNNNSTVITHVHRMANSLIRSLCCWVDENIF